MFIVLESSEVSHSFRSAMFVMDSQFFEILKRGVVSVLRFKIVIWYRPFPTWYVKRRETNGDLSVVHLFDRYKHLVGNFSQPVTPILALTL